MSRLSGFNKDRLLSSFFMKDKTHEDYKLPFSFGIDSLRYFNFHAVSCKSEKKNIYIKQTKRISIGLQFKKYHLQLALSKLVSTVYSLAFFFIFVRLFGHFKP